MTSHQMLPGLLDSQFIPSRTSILESNDELLDPTFRASRKAFLGADSRERRSYSITEKKEVTFRGLLLAKGDESTRNPVQGGEGSPPDQKLLKTKGLCQLAQDLEGYEGRSFLPFTAHFRL
ncbi:unnamed protein product [Victoria cruziana]